MPIVLQNGYRNLTVGLAGRAGPIFVGSDNLGFLINSTNPRGLDIYGGVFIPIYQKLPPDKNKCYTDQKMTFGERMKAIFSKKRN